MSHSYFIWKPRETSTSIFHECKFKYKNITFNGGGGGCNQSKKLT